MFMRNIPEARSEVGNEIIFFEASPRTKIISLEQYPAAAK